MKVINYPSWSNCVVELCSISDSIVCLPILQISSFLLSCFVDLLGCKRHKILHQQNRFCLRTLERIWKSTARYVNVQFILRLHYCFLQIINKYIILFLLQIMINEGINQITQKSRYGMQNNNCLLFHCVLFDNVRDHFWNVQVLMQKVLLVSSQL